MDVQRKEIKQREREVCAWANNRLRLQKGRKKLKEKEIGAAEKWSCVCGAVMWRTSDVRSVGQLGGFVSLRYYHLRSTMALCAYHRKQPQYKSASTSEHLSIHSPHLNRNKYSPVGLTWRVR